MLNSKICPRVTRSGRIFHPAMSYFFLSFSQTVKLPFLYNDLKLSEALTVYLYLPPPPSLLNSCPGSRRLKWCGVCACANKSLRDPASPRAASLTEKQQGGGKKDEALIPLPSAASSGLGTPRLGMRLQMLRISPSNFPGIRLPLVFM